MSSEQLGRSRHTDLAHIDYYSPEEIERGLRLHKLKRFETIKEMTHRTSVLEHELRVTQHSVIFSKVLLALGEDIDLRRVLFFADHHDDTEIETGDIPTPKKTSASGEEKAKMEQDERDAAQKVDRMVQKPLGFRSFPQEYEEYKSQRSIEARIVNYADKWDAIHEAVHEVICGDNKEGFRRVIIGYSPIFEELNKVNGDWQRKLKGLLGDDFFDLPHPYQLIPRSPDELNYKEVGEFMQSIAEDNPISYFFWLRFNKSLFKLDFLKSVFPGWMDKFPQWVLQDIERVRVKAPFKTTRSGLLVPSTTIDIETLTFGESLELDLLESQLVAIATITR